MSHASDKVVVGKVGAPHGVKGWFKAHSFTEQPEDLFSYQPWLIGDKTYTIEEWRHQGKNWTVKLEGIDTREAADLLKNADIHIDEGLLPELGDDEIYWRDLRGMQVSNEQGYDMGNIDDVFNTGANDVLQVKANAKDAFGKRERLIPVVFDEVIKHIDREARQVVVDWDPSF